MLLAKSIRRLGAVVALLGIGCLLVAFILPWTHLEPPQGPDDFSLFYFLITSFPLGRSRAPLVLILYLLPLLGACLVAIDGRRAWQGRAATRSSSALLLLGMGCALCGLAAISLLAGISLPSDMVPPPRYSAGPAVGLALLGFSAVVAGGVLLTISSGWRSAVLLAVALRHVGAAVALFGIGFLLLAPGLTWVHFNPSSMYYHSSDKEGVVPGDYSLLRLLVTPNRTGPRLAEAVLILYLPQFLGSCLVVVEALRAWQGSAATRAGIARLLLVLLLLGISCALFGLAAIPALVQVVLGIVTGGSVMPAWWVRVGEGPSLASLGFGAVVAGGVLLAVGAFLHHWTLRHNEQRASAM